MNDPRKSMKSESAPISETAAMKSPMSLLKAVFGARCPRCHVGKVTDGIFTIVPRCSNCDYNFNPESGFYLGAMMLGFLITSMLTIPPVIYLKVIGADDALLLGYPFAQYLILGPLLTYYAKILWLHLSYRASSRLDKVGRH